MKTLKVIRAYFDVQLQKKLQVDEVIKVKDARAKELLANPNLLVELIPERPKKIVDFEIKPKQKNKK